ncbi:MAG: [protein-PII] uridylyltransferase [Thermodesulfobacteriota bacterium]
MLVSRISQDKVSPIKVLISQTKALTEKVLQKPDPAFLTAQAQLLDEYFRESFAQSRVGPEIKLAQNPYAVVAQGGYGRREQCVHSDVDLLLLFSKKIPDSAAQLVQEIVYPLWDAGLAVGYATRTLKETVKLAAKDFEVLTSLLDARHVCGASNVYTDLKEALWEKVIRKKDRTYLNWLINSSQGRHERFGDSSYLLEPNIKEGQGGLRDYHAMLWAGRVRYGFTEARDMEYQGALTNTEYTELSEALFFLWAVRNHLHHFSGRKNDQLYFDYQKKVAHSLGFAGDEQNLAGIEAFLGRLHGHMDCIKHLSAMFLDAARPTARLRAKKAEPREIAPGIVEERDSVSFSSSRDLAKDPSLLIRIFDESLNRRLPLSVEARRLVREFLPLINDAFRRNPETVRTFERILKAYHPDVNILEEMLDTGFLPAFFPEFGAIVNRIQYTEYHVFPVDKHSLLTVRLLKRFFKDDAPEHDPLFPELAAQVASRKILLYAALFHDIGKAASMTNHAGAGAELAEKAMARMGYPDRIVEAVCFLVREHLLLPITATRRDLNDEQTSLTCARKVGNVQNLVSLYLLSCADSIATGPKAWNDWTASLLKELFFKVNQVLTRGGLATRKAIAVAEKKRAELFEHAPAGMNQEEISELFTRLPPRYLNEVPSPDMVRHVSLFRTLGAAPAVISVTPSREGALRVVDVLAKDRPGLFSRIAGVFTLNNINILDAQIYTWRNHTAVDVFRVLPPADTLFERDIWQRVERDLTRVLTGQLDLAEALVKKLSSIKKASAPTSLVKESVRVDNESSGFFTIIEVFAYDRLGLLYEITDAIFRSGLDIWVAKIATKADQIVDVFYVRDFDGQKVDDAEKVLAIIASLERALSRNGVKNGAA